MKMDNKRFETLKDAVNTYRKAFPDYSPNYAKDFERSRRWGYFWAAKRDLTMDDSHPIQQRTNRLVQYDASFDLSDLDDDHIDTALRKIMAEPAE